MYPSFKNLADKRNKLKQLALKNQQDLEIRKFKTQRYKNAIWATDVAPDEVSPGLLNERVNSIGIQATPDSTDTLIVSKANGTVGRSITTNYSNYGISDIDDSNETKFDMITQVELNDFDFQKNARNKIIDQYSINPSIIKKKVHPILVSGKADRNVYIGYDGKLFNTSNDKLSNKSPKLYDWVSTYDYILDLIEYETNDISIGSTTPYGFNIESGAYEVLRDILMNNDFPDFTILPIPYQIGRGRGGLNYIPINPAYRVKLVDGKLEIMDGEKIKSNIGRSVSWHATLEIYIEYLKQNNIPFKQSNIFKTSSSNSFHTITRPQGRSTSITNIEPINDDDKVISDDNNGVKDILIQLFNENDWLIDEKIPIKRMKGSTFAKNMYILGEYASILHKRGNTIPPKRLKTIDDNADWLGILNSIVEKYGDILVSTDIKVKTANPKKIEPRKLFSESSMIGLGVCGLKGRRAILKHEFHKLQGSMGLGNDNRKLEKELKLMRKIF